ncbi:AraC family transcriptional regulator [Rhizobium leguminosarum]|uniref:helix-turn-helix domain-containing protein n=1 Tax=Rhizobium leguminosarum TaxID=384 RepID=UPI0018016A4C|nr:AraC family transcriptional regulator [Rhizobium leguminosarum]MBB5666436.1 AraC family transcriptional regulator [Rhizobium leguminosarum]
MPQTVEALYILGFFASHPIDRLRCPIQTRETRPRWIMEQQHRLTVKEALSRSGACLQRSGSVDRGLSLAEWTNSAGQAFYERPDHHTLSIYLDGGERVIREDKRLSGGAPGKLCLLPAEHKSQWHIGGPLRMFHLYVDPELLAYEALTSFDIDPRHIDPMDLTFCDDPAMAMIVRGGVLPLNWQEKSNRVALDAVCRLLIHRILKSHNRQARQEAVRGGLSPSVRRRTADYIDANLDQALTLDRLAREAGLSTFHFAKMFRVSFGMPPHRYVAARRIEQAERLLRNRENSLAAVASACGFGSQSHFSKAFKATTGVPPGEWRSLP